MLAAAQDVDVPREKVWEVWKNLEDWPSWSNALHESASWKGSQRWEAGAEFEQLLKLGFPLGTQSSKEKIAEAIPAQRIVWAKDKDGIKACHIWSFETLPNGMHDQDYQL